LTTGIFGNFEGWRGEFLTFKTGIPGGPGRIGPKRVRRTGLPTLSRRCWQHRGVRPSWNGALKLAVILEQTNALLSTKSSILGKLHISIIH